jgi:4-amino-4-deoxy-L-arabinose transferase-like glycosyltransferase
VWGGWLLVTGLVYSLMSGIIHSYYAVALAPAIGALVGPGVVELWQRRGHSLAAGVVLAAGIMASAVLSAALLNRTPDFLPGIDIVLVTVAFGASVLIAAPPARLFPRLSLAAAAVALAVLLIGPAAYAANTVNTPYSGGDPSASLTTGRQGGTGGAGSTGGPGFPAAGDAAGATGVSSTSQALYDYLAANRGTASWIVAVQSADQAAAIELATGEPVMAIGGFSGTDPAPTLDQLKSYVASGRLRFVIVGSGGPGGGFGDGGPGGAFGGSSALTKWITANGTLVTSVGGVNLYDLSGAAPSAT